jgi:hypothetical protein
MMRTLCSSAAMAVVVVVGMTSGLMAQTPAGTAFSYQGRLTDNGVAANGTYDLQFTLFDADTAGSAIGTPVVKDDVTVSGGLFTVMLDFGAAFDGHARWIEIGVRPGASSGAFTVLGARQPITPAPQALFSLSSQSSQTSVTSTTSASTPWSGITGVPDGFADGVDNDTLGALACGLNQIPKSNGTTWACAIDNDNSGTQWNLAGNAGTGGGAILGTTDNQPFELRANGQRALRIVPATFPFGDAPQLIGGFSSNTVTSATGATIAGGGRFLAPNAVLDDYGTVSGGIGNSADNYAAVGGGSNNSATGMNSTVPGGANNQAAGNYSFAAGHNTFADTGSFVWGDSGGSIGIPARSNGTDRFVVIASGGVYFGDRSSPPHTGFAGFINTSTGAYLSTGGVWTNASDRNLKEHFAPVDGRALLDSLARLPVTQWNYKKEPNVQHIGPTAQDFQAVFGFGGDDKTITTLDPSGIALRAIQELDRQNRALQSAIDDLKAQLAALAAEVHGKKPQKGNR